MRQSPESKVMVRSGNRRKDCTVIAERYVQATQFFDELNGLPRCHPERVLGRVMRRRWFLPRRGMAVMLKAKALGLLFEVHRGCSEFPKGEEEDPRSLIRGCYIKGRGSEVVGLAYLEGGWTDECIHAGSPWKGRRSYIVPTREGRA